MNRKEFLKNCACGLCSCAAVGLIAPESAPGAETKAPEDWRLKFVKERYAKLLGILSSRMDEKTLNETLFELGTYTNFSLRLHYSGEAGKERDAEAIPFEPA